MEEESLSLVNYVPTFARGSNLLLVHNDTTSLMYVSALLEQYSFHVTTTDDASVAASMICNHEFQFKIVMAKANMPGMDTRSFFNMLHEKDIPLIYIISRDFDVVTWELLLQGSCYFLKEPILSKNLNHVWEHMFPSKDAQNENCENKFKTTQRHVDKANGMDSDNNGNSDKGRVEIREEARAGGKKRILWTEELHKKFTEAIATLRYHKIAPKEIQRVMNVPGLTTSQISSHLQKYKRQMKCSKIAEDSDLPPVSTSSNSSSRTKLGSTTSVDTSVDQNQCATHDESIKLLEEDCNNDNCLLNEINLDQYIDHVAAPMDQNKPATEFDIMTLLEVDCDTGNFFGNGINPSDVDQLIHNEGQSLGVPMDQNHPAAEYDDIMKMLMEDCDSGNSFRNGINPSDADQYINIEGQSLGAPMDQNQPAPEYDDIMKMLMEDSDTESFRNGIHPSDADQYINEGQSPGAPMDQNQPVAEYGDIMKMLMEDCDSDNSFRNGINPSDVDQYINNGDQSLGAPMDQNQPAAEYDDITKMLMKDCDSDSSHQNGINPSDASMDKNQPATEYDDIFKIFEEDYDTENHFGNGWNPSSFDQ